jgi:DNA-directed RNA polymerase beta subunit
MARGSNDTTYVEIPEVGEDIAQRFYNLCDRKGVRMHQMFETMVRSFDRGSTTYGLDMRIDFGKYSGMNMEDLIRTDTRYVRWLVNTSEWFRIDSAAERLLKQMEG